MRLLTLAPGETVLQADATVPALYWLVHGRMSLWKGAQRVWQCKAPYLLGLEGYYAEHQLSPYTAVADTAVRLARYAPSEIQGELFASESMRTMALHSISHQLQNWWHSIGETPAQDSVYYPAEIQSYPPGSTIIQEGEQSRELYRIVSCDEGLEVRQNSVRLDVLRQPGEFFGEMAALLQQPRTATIRSLGHCVLEVYPPGALNDALATHPDLALRVVTTLAQRLAAANRRHSGNDGSDAAT